MMFTIISGLPCQNCIAICLHLLEFNSAWIQHCIQLSFSSVLPAVGLCAVSTNHCSNALVEYYSERIDFHAFARQTALFLPKHCFALFQHPSLQYVGIPFELVWELPLHLHSDSFLQTFWGLEPRLAVEENNLTRIHPFAASTRTNAKLCAATELKKMPPMTRRLPTGTGYLSSFAVST